VSAVISKCGQYRYTLTRPARNAVDAPPAVFIMLNPSVADAVNDDPTIRRCRSFAEDWGYGGIVVANLYAAIATHRSDLWRHPAPVGPRNNSHLRKLAAAGGAIVCAWGGDTEPKRVAEVVAVLKGAGATLLCLGTTKDGAPRHPLYVRKDQPLVEWL
jgi:hypothetical protein